MHNSKKEIRTSLYALSLKRRARTPLHFLLGKRHPMTEEFKGTKGTKGMEAIAFVASVKYQAWTGRNNQVITVDTILKNGR